MSTDTHRAFTLDDSIVCRCSKGSDHALIRPDGSFPDRDEVRELENPDD